MRLKTVSLSLLVASVLLPAIGAVSVANESTYVEFLWSPTPEGAIARQVTRGFVLDGNQHHQVCMAVLDPATETNVLRVEAIDASG